MAENDMAKKIKDLRVSQKLTLEQVANQVGVGKSTVRKWETGMIANMRRDKIAALAKALHTTPAYLMGWTDEQAQETPVSQEAHERTMYALDLLSKLSPEKKEEALRYLDYLASQDKK